MFMIFFSQKGYFLGETIPPVGLHLTVLGGKIGKNGFFRSDKFAAKYSLSVFWKFINKNAIKSGFEGGIGRNISKTSKKCPFFSKLSRYIYQDPPKNTSTKVPRPFSPEISLSHRRK